MAYNNDISFPSSILHQVANLKDLMTFCRAKLHSLHIKVKRSIKESL